MAGDSGHRGAVLRWGEVALLGLPLNTLRRGFAALLPGGPWEWGIRFQTERKDGFRGLCLRGLLSFILFLSWSRRHQGPQSA